MLRGLLPAFFVVGMGMVVGAVRRANCGEVQMIRNVSLSVLLAMALSFGSVSGQDTALLSPRNASYTIDVRLDPSLKTLEGREVITWRNIMQIPTRELRFHVYWNAWKNNRSTWMQEASLSGRRRTVPEEGDWSYCQLKSIKVLPSGLQPGAGVTPATRFAAPDDGNTNDETVLVTPLPQSVGPGESVMVELSWRSHIPRTFARTGFRDNYFFIAQWFPKVGVYQADGKWNCHQFHAGTEFFSDYGVYDVRMTVPRGWLLGATGEQMAIRNNPDGTTTHEYVQADVHDFAWTTSPDYQEARRSFELSGLKPVQMRLLYQPEHASQVDRHFRATEATLRYYGSWFGEYPYGHITIIDPAWESGTGGMEYPTLFTCGSRILNPEGGGSPEGVTVHEAGHQFWYGIVGNNEFEDAWLDEGFNTFCTARTMDVAFGETSYVYRLFRSHLPYMIPEIKRHRMTGGNGLDGYRGAARSDIEATPSFRYFPATGGSITYSKTALWLSMLEKMLGWDTLQKILATHFQRWRFRHPKPDDFFAIANEVSGRDLTGFFDQVYRKAAVFDYSVESVASDELKTEGFVDKDGRPVYAAAASGAPRLYQTRVVVSRLGDGVLPVDVLLRFENGEEFRDVWDGQNSWKMYTLVKPVKLSYAVVDPDRKILLDINYTNNSRVLVPRTDFAASKWASKWMISAQDYLQALAFLF
ncbi:MAG TPA: M1 family metallopeptidase [Acidobacteriota bacterium]|nr:M1 family metallopeptidase [Acidobacteriota bacterium]